MQLFSLPATLRLSAAAYFLARAGVSAQGPGLDPSSICDGTVTVTFIPPLSTVTVYTSGIFNVTDLIPSGLLTSLVDPVGSLSSLIPDSLITTSPSLGISLSLPTISAIPTGLFPTDSNGLPDFSQTLISVPTGNIGLPELSQTLISIPTDTLPTSDVVPGQLSSLPTQLSSLSLTDSLLSPLPTTLPTELPSIPLTDSLLSPILTTLPTILPTTLPSLPTTGIQASSLLNELGASASLPVESPTFGLTTPLQISTLPSLSLPTLSLSSPSLSLPGILSDLTTLPVTLTGPSIFLGSGSVSLGLPSTSLNLPLPTIPTAIPTATVLALVSCPEDDGLNFLLPSRKALQIECTRRRLGGDVTSTTEPDLESCAKKCDELAACRAVSYNAITGECSIKSATGVQVLDVTRDSASSIDLSCPGADGVTYMDYTGSFYRTMCDYVFPEGTGITTAPGTDYIDCSDKCSNIASCTGFSYTDGTCTFLGSYGNPPNGARRNGTNTAILLAKRAVVVRPDGSTITSASVPVTVPSYTVSRTLPPVVELPVTDIVDTLLPTSLVPLTTLLDGSISVVSSLLNDITLSDNIPLPTGIIPTTPIISLSSALLPTSQLPTQTPVAFSCPNVNGQIIIENGQSYIVDCDKTSSGTSYSAQTASNSFNDCFRECNQSSTFGGANYCTAFTYEGALNGAGPGTCYLYNGVAQSFQPSSGRNSITAIRAVNYVPAAVSSLVSEILATITEAVPSISLPAETTTLIPSISLPIDPSVSLPAVLPTPLGTSASASVDCSLPGANLIAACIAATITAAPSIGAEISVGIPLGPSGSTIPIVEVSVNIPPPISVSVGVDLGLGVGVNSDGLSVGVNPTIGVGVGAPLVETLVSDVVVPVVTEVVGGVGSAVGGLGGAVGGLLGGSQRTTTVFTTSTITSCLTSAGILTCPIGGLFTALPSSSGAVTSVSTSTSISVSVSISYVTVTALPSSTPAPIVVLPTLALPGAASSTFATLTTTTTTTTTTSRTSTTSSVAAAAATPCRGTINALGVCILR